MTTIYLAYTSDERAPYPIPSVWLKAWQGTEKTAIGRHNRCETSLHLPRPLPSSNDTTLQYKRHSHLEMCIYSLELSQASRGGRPSEARRSHIFFHFQFYFAVEADHEVIVTTSSLAEYYGRACRTHCKRRSTCQTGRLNRDSNQQDPRTARPRIDHHCPANRNRWHHHSCIRASYGLLLLQP